MTAPKITLYFDVVSPFAYEAYHILKHNPTFKHVQITLVPIFLGGLMKACNNSPPITIKNKDKWINQERLRWARLFDVPMHDKVVDNFPPNTLHTMRALAAVPTQDQLARVVDRLWHDFFVHRRPIESRDVFEPAVRDVLGHQAADNILLASPAQLDQAKSLLKANTDKAFAEGAFGVPWFVCTTTDGTKTDSFWGVDHMGQVADFLGLDRSLATGIKALL